MSSSNRKGVPEKNRQTLPVMTGAERDSVHKDMADPQEAARVHPRRSTPEHAVHMGTLEMRYRKEAMPYAFPLMQLHKPQHKRNNLPLKATWHNQLFNYDWRWYGHERRTETLK